MAIEKKKLSDLRVVDLREELEKRGLEKGGTKPVLIERLKKAIQDEGGDPNEIEVEAGEKPAAAKKAAGARRTPVRRTKKEEQEEANADGPAEDGMETESADVPDSLSLKDEPMDDLDVLDEDDSIDQQEMDTIDDLGEDDGSEPDEVSALNGEDQTPQEEEVPTETVAMETADAPETIATATDGEEGKEEVAEDSAEVPSSEVAEVTTESATEPSEPPAAVEAQPLEGAAAQDSQQETETEMDAASLVDKVLNETGETADDVALSAEQEEELLTEDEVGEGEAETPAEEKDKEGSNNKIAPKEEPVQPAKPAGAKVVAPGDAPVPFPLTSKDLLEMHVAVATKDEEENISLVVHADDQMIADLDADLLDTPKDAATSAEGAPEVKEPAKEQENAEEPSKEAAVAPEGEGAKTEAAEAKGSEEGKKPAEAAGEKNKESSAKKGASVSVRTRSASGKDTKDAKAPPTKDEKARHGSSSSSSKNLWVSGLSSTTRATDLKAAFSKYGKVVGAKVVTNARSPGARCYGFVTMSSSEEAARCITHLHRTELHGRMISVERAKNDPSSSSKKPPEKKEPEKRDLRSSSARKPSADARKPAPKKEDKDKKEAEKKPEEKKDEKEEKKEEEKRSASQTRRSTGDKTAPAAAKDKEGGEKEGTDKDGKEGTRTVVMDKKKGEPVVTVKDSKRDSKSKEKDGQQPRKGSKEKQGEILSFDKIKEQRERERQRQRERELREMERRRAERERRERERQREIIQREREEREKLQRERERLQRERERLEREKQERERLERERMRIERERAREQERIAREREETRRLQLQLEEERRQLKRALEAPRERDSYWSEPKRQYEGDFHRNAPETNRFNDYDNRERGAGYTRDVDHRSAAPPPDPYERRVERYDRRDNTQRRDDQPPSRYNENSRDVPPRRDDIPPRREDQARRDEPRRDIRDRDTRRTPTVPSRRTPPGPRERGARTERGHPPEPDRIPRGTRVPPRERPAERPDRSRSPHRRSSPRPSREEWKSERSLPSERRDGRARVAGSAAMRGGMDPISKGMSNPTSSMSYGGREPAPVGMQSHDSRFPLDDRRPREQGPPRDDWGPAPPDDRSRAVAPRASASSYSDRQISTVGDNRPGLLGSAPSRGGDSRDWSSGDRLRKAEPQRQPGTDGHGWPMGGLENPTVNRLGERWPGSMGQQQVDSRGGTRGVLAVSAGTMSQHQRTAGGYISAAPQHHAQPPPATQLLSRAPAVGGFGGPDRHKPAQDNRFDPYSRAPPARRY
ncbi:SAFB2 [Branchiostoma lanceolatum]|uniref:SAFB2 protein n=2 Tax=Branchiostoma lanceolatum TaxID=7740 RepID=A0A8K0EG24_BRALA|nr:SAFB2 [Branchiostoma lanceolatum]